MLCSKVKVQAVPLRLLGRNGLCLYTISNVRCAYSGWAAHVAGPYRCVGGSHWKGTGQACCAHLRTCRAGQHAIEYQEEPRRLVLDKPSGRIIGQRIARRRRRACPACPHGDRREHSPRGGTGQGQKSRGRLQLEAWEAARVSNEDCLVGGGSVNAGPTMVTEVSTPSTS